MILAAAIRKRKTDEVFTGRRHHEIINNAGLGFFQGDEQGFVTVEGKFVSREEAAKIAFECKQIPYLKATLFSEDLW